MKIVKGSTVKLQSTVYLDQEQVQIANLTGASIRSMFKKNPRDADADALLTKNVGTGVTITSALTGVCETDFTASESLNLSYSRIYFEILVKLADGTYIRGGVEEIELLANVLKELN